MVTSVVGDRRSSPPCEDHEEQDPLQEPLPLEPTDFSVTDLYFWQVGELPLGCVLTFACPEVEEGTPEPRMVAVLVQSRELNDHGHTLGVRFLGAMSALAREWGIKRFSKEKKMVHLCREPGGDFCQAATRAIHVKDFCYWPPGSFNAEYADKKFMKEMKDFLSHLEEGRGIPPGGEVPSMPDGAAIAEDKLAALRKKLLVAKTKAAPSGGRRVSFSDPVQVTPISGILKRGRLSSPVKQEALEVLSSDSEHPVKKKKPPKQRESTIGSALVAAVERRNLGGSNNAGSSNRLRMLDDACNLDGKQKKSKKKKRKKKKKKKDSDGSSSESSTSGSSSSPLKPPLQRKAERKPGSVLRLLMDHVRVALSDMSLLEGEGDGPAQPVTSSARVQSYFQILVRPHLQGRPRDEKELYSLAVAIDTLRGGDIQRLADMLAGRYLAVETAALEGSWETAKWLEVSRLEDRGAASSDILLAARKHQRVIDRASGRGSFSRSYDQYWASGHGEWTDAPTGRGKGKHGKKGKGKGKKSKNSKKSQSDPWWTGGNPEKDQKDPEGTK